MLKVAMCSSGSRVWICSRHLVLWWRHAVMNLYMLHTARYIAWLSLWEPLTFWNTLGQCSLIPLINDLLTYSSISDLQRSLRGWFLTLRAIAARTGSPSSRNSSHTARRRPWRTKGLSGWLSELESLISVADKELLPFWDRDQYHKFATLEMQVACPVSAQ